MATDARMIGVSQEGDRAESIDLDLGWVRTMEARGFNARAVDVGGPLLSTVAVLSVVEAKRVNEAMKARATGKTSPGGGIKARASRQERQCAEQVDALLEKIGTTRYFSAWVIVETANID